MGEKEGGETDIERKGVGERGKRGREREREGKKR